MNSATDTTPSIGKENSDRTQGDGYRFDRLRTSLILQDMRFSRASLKPGERLPDFELLSPDGEPIRAADLLGGSSIKALLIVTGSLTCPMTIGSLDEVRELHEEFGDEIPFLLLYVREAHPGENFPQPKTYSEKVEHARCMRESYDVSWPVAVDDIDPTLHRSLDTKPNSVHLIDSTGIIVFRALFAGDIGSLRKALIRLSTDQTIEKKETQAFLGPVISAIGHIQEVMDRAGPGAWRDLWFAAPPMAAIGRLARVFMFQRKSRRGAALMITTGFVAAVTILWALIL